MALFVFNPFHIEYPQYTLPLALGFILLVALLWNKAKPAATKALKSRADKVQEEIERAESLRAQAQQVHDEYASRLASIEREHQEQRDRATAEANSACAIILADAREAAEAITRRATEEVARERTRQRILLRRQVVEMTISAAESAIATLQTDQSQHVLIQAFTERLGAGKMEKN